MDLLKRTGPWFLVCLFLLAGCSDSENSGQTTPASSTSAENGSSSSDSDSDRPEAAGSQAQPSEATENTGSSETSGRTEGGIPTGPPQVVIDTSYGEIVVELTPDRTPTTVRNFLQYVEDGFYSGTIIHRIADNPAVIQGGGFGTDYAQKEPKAPIRNEAKSGGKNMRGTIAMARTRAVDSATSQFYINYRDNAFLDDPNMGGYCVFGEVVEGMGVVDEIAAVNRGTKMMTASDGQQYPFSDVPVEDVVIRSMRIK